MRNAHDRMKRTSILILATPIEMAMKFTGQHDLMTETRQSVLRHVAPTEPTVTAKIAAEPARIMAELVVG